ncbi:MAG TPA: hypothetical protein VGM62_12200 [Chthoniobacterales bacterium]|jgi:hypothetical protein
MMIGSGLTCKHFFSPTNKSRRSATKADHWGAWATHRKFFLFRPVGFGLANACSLPFASLGLDALLGTIKKAGLACQNRPVIAFKQAIPDFFIISRTNTGISAVYGKTQKIVEKSKKDVDPVIPHLSLLHPHSLRETNLGNPSS